MQKIVSHSHLTYQTVLQNHCTDWLQIINDMKYLEFLLKKKNGIFSTAKTFVQITRLDISTCLIFTTPNPNEKIRMGNERLR